MLGPMSSATAIAPQPPRTVAKAPAGIRVFANRYSSYEFTAGLAAVSPSGST